MDRMMKQENADYTGWGKLIFMFKLTIKKPDFYGKAYHLDVVNSFRSSVSVMSKLFDLT